MALSRATNRWITRHLANSIRINRQQECLATHSGGCQRSLNAGVARTYYNHVVLLGKNEHGQIY